MKKIVLISVGQPSTNPRLVKEANTLEAAGYKVYVIYSYWTQWASEADKVLFSKVKWTPILAGGSPFEHTLTYFFTRLRVKLAQFIAQNITFKFGIAEIAKGRTYPALLKKAKLIKADLYIAHILAALPAAVKAAKKNKAKCGFDAEDFHRQEASDDTGFFNFRISKYIEDKYLPLTNYITGSSPLIAGQYEQLYDRGMPVLLNVFPKVLPAPSVINNTNKPLKLFWFSQTIGPSRGLELIVEAIGLTKIAMEFHLLGMPANSYKAELLQQAQTEGIDSTMMHFYDPVQADEIFKLATRFDIGLASETGFCLNNKSALSNKLFTYVGCGLAVVASNTPAQVGLLAKYPQVGKIYNNAAELAAILTQYHQNRELLFKTKNDALILGQTTLNWEAESQAFLKIIADTLAN